jgi:signal transduction histidine kinase/ActR/RegA family two-component response regulator
VTQEHTPQPDRAWSSAEEAVLSAWRLRTSRPVLRTAAILCTLTVAMLGFQLWQRGLWLPTLWAIGLTAGLWVVTLSERIPVRLRTQVMLALMYGASVLQLCKHGLAASGFLSTFAYVALAAILLGRRAALVSFALALTTLTACGVGFSLGYLHVADPTLIDASDWLNWLRIGVYGASIAAAVGGAGMLLLRELAHAISQRTRLVSKLELEAQERERALSALAQAQERLLHAHKLEAVGRLSGGIAHDFNNTLTVILSYAELLRSRLGNEQSLVELSDQIIQAAEQGGDLTKQLLTFSRKQIIKPRVLDLNQVLKASERTLSRLVPKSVRVRRREAREPLHVYADPTQLQQAVLNLALNARDAMPEGGDLTLELELEGGEAGRGPFVAVRVRDTGTGMNEETKKRIFEPFFTTKAPGLGTGLGLANVRETVEAAGGHVAVESELERGSTFTMYLPLAEARVSGIEERLPAARRAHASVLVVDDEPQIREVIRTMLADSGYEAVTADSARAALGLIENGRIDLVCTDLVMPDMSGGQLIEEVRKLFPSMPIIVCSAYGTDENVSQRVATGDVQYLTKPFARRDLLDAIERALSRRSLLEGQAEAATT